MTGCETQDAAVAAATVADDAPSALLADLPARLRALNRLPRLNGGSEPPDGADRDDDQARRHKGGANSPEAQLAGIPAGDATTTASPRNCADQLVGVPTASATVPGSAGGSIGLGFAIPVDLAKAVADEIIATGRMTHALFGLATVPIPPAAAAQAALPEGLYV
jgi:hypothetical protein